MNIEPGYTAEQLRFREYYRSLRDNDLARLSMGENLVPAARNAMTDELTARAIDLFSYQSRFAEEVAAAKAAGVLGGIPSSALVTEEQEKNQQWFGLAGLVMFGLVVIHKWLLGDATTWRKEETLALCLFSALMFTWDPTVRLLRGQASGKLVFWLVLGWSYFAAIAATLAVPSLGRVVAGSNPLLIATAIASPAIVVGVRRAVRRFRPAPRDPAERFALMFERFASDSLWAEDYDKFVHDKSFAKPDEVISFRMLLVRRDGL